MIGQLWHVFHRTPRVANRDPFSALPLFAALKTADHQRFIINGDYTISLSGLYQGAGTTFEYRRIDGLNNGSAASYRRIEGVTEWITAPGPTAEAIQLYLLSQQPNPGVKYEYLMPINTNPAVEQGSSGEDNRIDGEFKNLWSLKSVT